MPSDSERHIAALGLGSNLGDRAQALSDALGAIRARGIGSVLRVSSVWETPPWGNTDQPPFLNACALVETTLAPHALLAALKKIEQEAGRVPGPRWGPRPLDLDILFYDGLTLADAALTLPHPLMLERAFVLAPLAELGIDRVGSTRIAYALARVDLSGLHRCVLPDWPPHRREEAVGERITLRCADGATISAWRARPAGPPKGGIVVLQEIFGVNAHIRSVADRYAQAGYLAIAPALFDRVERDVELGYDGADMTRARDLRARTTLDGSLRDIEAAIAVAAEGGPVGVVGFCWGGSLAWDAAARLGGINAAVGYYGGTIASSLDHVPQVPIILHFGAKDKHIPLTDVEKIRDAFPAVPVYVYDADHGFNCDARASFDAAAAQTAGQRTAAFFDEHLR